MMTWKKYFPLGFAVLFAILASVSVYQFLNDRGGASGISHANIATALPIVIAKAPVGVGEKIKEHDLEIVSWPEKSAPQDSFKSLRPLIGRTAKVNMAANEPIVESKLLPDGENFSFLIPLGMRAVTVSVKQSEALAQILERGGLVDVLALVTFQNTGIVSAKVIVPKARVIAVHKPTVETGRRGEQTTSNMEVTLIVTPKEAEWIIAAMSQGGIDLVVRNSQEPTANLR
ncbi:MAG: Flp pilus assembly protein CpaB [Candidatus Omnitrophica bacterium]|nr:Flp pilus assembly protein CpaB [Candidatus Omnitrophota bacterium]